MPNRTIVEDAERLGLNADQIRSELKSWSRNSLIEWLCWNDPNGVYRDRDSMREFGNVLGKKEAILIATNQILQQ